MKVAAWFIVYRWISKKMFHDIQLKPLEGILTLSQTSFLSVGFSQSVSSAPYPWMASHLTWGVILGTTTLQGTSAGNWIGERTKVTKHFKCIILSCREIPVGFFKSERRIFRTTSYTPAKGSTYLREAICNLKLKVKT